MAGHHPAMVEGGLYSFSQDKPEVVDRWYLSRKDIEENSPSRRDGIDLKKETYLRKSYCTFLQDLGMRLKVPQVTIATAIIFSHRFFLHQSHAKNDRRIIATVCMFLAAKVEETPRPLKDVILVSYEIINKKDPAAVQRIKQKEVYEQQKELILFGERVVLATLGFDFNINHPYKPLVEAIKKFKVAQNALAQVAWNFVNDGLRTSLCMQFKPHHIAAGAIFLAAKFLKVKLPSDGEKVWWQEFDVTPRQLEEVSNQMLELYEQNRGPAPQGSEVEGSAGRVGSHQAPPKPPIANEESVSVNKSYAQAGGVSSAKPGPVVPSFPRPGVDQSNADSQGGPRKSSQSKSNEYEMTDARGDNVDNGLDNGLQNDMLSAQEPLSNIRDNKRDASERSRFGSEQLVKDHERNNGGSTTIKLEEPKKETASFKVGSTGQNLKHEDHLISQSPQNGMKKIDKDKVKAALEKRRKSRGDVTRKMDVIDDDDLIERELEDGIEMAVEDEKIKQVRKQGWSKTSNWSDVDNPIHMTDSNSTKDGNYLEMGGHDSGGLDADNVEEGEMRPSDKAERFQSPKSNSRKRKGESLDERRDGNHHDYTPGYHSNHHDTAGDKIKIGHLGHAERDHKRHAQENIS